jgi:hypothetical protein
MCYVISDWIPMTRDCVWSRSVLRGVGSLQQVQLVVADTDCFNGPRDLQELSKAYTREIKISS